MTRCETMTANECLEGGRCGYIRESVFHISGQPQILPCYSQWYQVENLGILVHSFAQHKVNFTDGSFISGIIFTLPLGHKWLWVFETVE